MFSPLVESPQALSPIDWMMPLWVVGARAGCAGHTSCSQDFLLSCQVSFCLGTDHGTFSHSQSYRASWRSHAASQATPRVGCRGGNWRGPLEGLVIFWNSLLCLWSLALLCPPQGRSPQSSLWKGFQLDSLTCQMEGSGKGVGVTWEKDQLMPLSLTSFH